MSHVFRQWMAVLGQLVFGCHDEEVVVGPHSTKVHSKLTTAIAGLLNVAYCALLIVLTYPARNGNHFLIRGSRL